jgi:hypothetical protein
LPDAAGGGGQTATLSLTISAPGRADVQRLLTLTSRYAWLYGSGSAGTRLYNTPANATTYAHSSASVFNAVAGINPFNPTSATGVQSAGTQEKDYYSSDLCGSCDDGAVCPLEDDSAPTEEETLGADYDIDDARRAARPAAARGARAPRRARGGPDARSVSPSRGANPPLPCNSARRADTPPSDPARHPALFARDGRPR